MLRRLELALAPRSALARVALVALVTGTTLGSPQSASAQDCHVVDWCDELLDPSKCTTAYCPDPVDTGDLTSGAAGKGKYNFGTSPGGERGAGLVTEAVRTLRELIGGDVRATPPDASDEGTAAANDYGLDDQATAVADDAYEAGTPPSPPPSPVGEVPTGQGGDWVSTPNGVPDDNGQEGVIVDPINPANGEFVHQNVDLGFTGFGIAFVHKRYYRSRLDYDGVLGHGWDHSYNRRLIHARPAYELPPLDIADGGGGSTTGTTPGAAYCGEVLFYTTGMGTTLRFREVGRSETEVFYEAGDLTLTLRGHIASDGAVTWELSWADGTTARFDEFGLLVALVDANEVGLTFEWEPGGGRVDWRLAHVIDSVGRLVEYSYTTDDYLVGVSEASSGLFAAYEFDGSGQLSKATDHRGVTETYEYDFDDRPGGDWMPEGALYAACEQACAPASSSCDAGGACDAPVEQAMTECLGSCGACAAECRGACAGSPGHPYGLCEEKCNTESSCAADCTDYCASAEAAADITARCDQAWETFAEPACRACEPACEAGDPNGGCALFANCLKSVKASGTWDGESGSGSGWDGEWDPEAELSEECELTWDLLDDAVGVPELMYDALGGFLDCMIPVECYTSWDFPYIHCTYDGWNLDGCSFDALVTEWEETCDKNYTLCCRDGDACGDNSCNADNGGCYQECEQVFRGVAGGNHCITPEFEAVAFECGTEVPSPGTSEYANAIACARSHSGFGTVAEWAPSHGCEASLAASCGGSCQGGCLDQCEWDCLPSCNAACDDACHTADCADYCESVDLMGQCQTGCVAGCVDAERAKGPFVGPKYGKPRDLDHNLVRIRDGGGAVVVANTYGDDIGLPSFDSVTHQVYGDYTADLYYRDLRAEHGGAVAPPATGPAAAYVDPIDAFESVEICPYECDAGTNNPPGEFVPWDDLLLFFAEGTSYRARWLVRPRSLGALAPVSLTFSSAGDAATLVGEMPSSLRITTSAGDVRISYFNGQVTVDADPSARALVAGRTLTVVTDRKLGVHAYVGHPAAVLHVAGGSCSVPFQAQRLGAQEVQLVPADACRGNLEIRALASLVTDTQLAQRVVQMGPTALDGYDLLRETPLSPGRGAFRWTRAGNGQSGTMVGRDGPTARATAQAGGAAQQLFSGVRLFGPVNTARPWPLFVYHTRPTRELTTNPMPVDELAGERPPGLSLEPLCNPGVPMNPQRGIGADGPGPLPARAVVLMDYYGVPRTYYMDGANAVIRRVNHGTGAVRSYNYQDGHLVGMEQPEGDRVCARYDRWGNPTDLILMPVPGARGDTMPMWQRAEYSPPPTRLLRVYDPRRGPLDTPSSVLQSMEYDERGNLTRVVTTDGVATVEPVGGTGPDAAQPHRIVSADFVVTLMTYDAETGALDTVVRDADGLSPETASHVADPAGRTVWARQPLGATATIDWEAGRMRSTTFDADGLFEFTEYGYDAAGRVRTVSRDDRTVTLTYDSTGNIATSIAKTLDGSAEPSITCSHVGPDGRLLGIVYPEGNRARFTYDGDGRLVEAVAGSLPAEPGSWDDACATSFQGGVAAEGVVGTAAYNLNGWQTINQDAFGSTVATEYDGFGRPIVITNDEGTTVRFGYDALSQILWTASYSVDGATVPYRRPLWSDAGLVAATEYLYDDAGRVSEVKRWHFDDTGTPVGDGYAITKFAYDMTARRVFVTDDAGNVTITNYDGLGRRHRVELPTGDEVITHYADGGRTVHTARSAPTPSGWATSTLRLTAWGAPDVMETTDAGLPVVLQRWQYDDHRRLTTHIDVAGRTVTYGYDAFDRVVSQNVMSDVAAVELVTFDWDRNGWLTHRISDAEMRTAVRSFGYDALGRLRRVEDPEHAVTYTTYKGASNLPDVRTDERGYQAHHSYDAVGRLGRVRVVAPGGSVVQWRDFGYDALGRTTRAVRIGELPTWAGTEIRTELTWDSLGLRTSELGSMLGGAGEVSHTYDGRGFLTASAIAGVTVDRQHDSIGRLTDVFVESDTMPAAHFLYRGLGGPVERQYRNGVRTYYRYNELGYLTNIVDQAPGIGQLAQWRYVVPADGIPRVAALTRPGTGERASVYQADAGGRVKNESHAVLGTSLVSMHPASSTSHANSAVASFANKGDWRGYRYDGRHNWVTRTTAAGSVAPEYDLSDALLDFGAGDAVFDERGALLSDGLTTFEYDAFGEVVEITGTGPSYILVRDAFGRLVARQDANTGAIERYGYDGERRVIRETSTGIDVTVEGQALDEHLVNVGPNGQRLYYHQDRIGSVYLVTDGLGREAERYDYTAFGEMTITSPTGMPRSDSAVGNRFGFQGQVFDAAYGLVDMRARIYQPRWGRFISRDPIGLLGGANEYAFVSGAPLSFTDPLGLKQMPGKMTKEEWLELALDYTQGVFERAQNAKTPTWWDRATGAVGDAFDWAGDKIYTGLEMTFDGAVGLLDGMAGSYTGPQRGHSTVYHLGLGVGGLLGIGVDGAMIGTGGMMMTGGGACLAVSGGSAAVVCAPVAAAGAGLAATGLTLLDDHKLSVKDHVPNFV